MTMKVRIVSCGVVIMAIIIMVLIGLLRVDDCFNAGNGDYVRRWTILGFEVMTSTEPTKISDEIERLGLIFEPDCHSTWDRYWWQSRGFDGSRRPAPSSAAARLEVSYMTLINSIESADVPDEDRVRILKLAMSEARTKTEISGALEEANVWLERRLHSK